MKRFFALYTVLVLLLSFPVHAVESDNLEPTEGETPVSVETTTTEENGVIVNVTLPPQAQSESLADSESVSLDSQTVQVVSISPPTLYSAGASDSAAPAMADVVVQILGTYQPKTYTVDEYNAQGELVSTSVQYVPGLAGLDYHWISGATIFALFLFCLLKMVGGLLCNR